MAKATTTPSVEVATVSNEDILAIINAQQDEALSEGPLQVPIVKLCQALTKEVTAGDAEAGEFLNTLTGESYGDSIEFIVSLFQYGRAASSEDGKYYVYVSNEAPDQQVIPDSWKDLVGESFVGTLFSEYPDAEEVYKERVNNGEIEWKKGPKISTTYNYTGLIVTEDGVSPGRITLQRSTKKAHDKIRNLKKSVLRGKSFWDAVFELSTVVQTFGRNDAYVINVKKTRPTTPDEIEAATGLAVEAAGGRITDNSAEAEKGSARVAPETDGGLGL